MATLSGSALEAQSGSDRTLSARRVVAEGLAHRAIQSMRFVEEWRKRRYGFAPCWRTPYEESRVDVDH
jgi:hypothetical protein